MTERLGKLWDASHAEEADRRLVEYERAKAGRVSIPAGEKNGRAKLTVADVAAIRSEIGKKTIADIARGYGVNRRTIEKIRDGEIWKTA